MTTEKFERKRIYNKILNNIIDACSFFALHFICLFPFVQLISYSSTLKRNRLTNITADAISNLSNLRILWVSEHYIYANDFQMFALQIEYNANFVLCTLFSFSQTLFCSLLILLSFFCISLYNSTFFADMNNTRIHFFSVVVIADAIATWMIICLQRYPVNWQNRQIYRNCKLREIIFRHIFMYYSSICYLHLPTTLFCSQLFCLFCIRFHQVFIGKSNKYHTQRWSSKKSNYIGVAWQSIRRY